MSSHQTQLTVRILERDYQVACPEGERESLLTSAEYLSSRMRSIQKKGKTLSMERIAVMAALNMARDLVDREKHQHSHDSQKDAIDDRLQQLQLTVESTLGGHG